MKLPVKLLACLFLLLAAIPVLLPASPALAQDSGSAAPANSTSTPSAPASASPASASPATTAAGVNAEQARQTLDVLQNDAKRNQLIQVLQTIANTPTANIPAASKPADNAPTPAAAPSPAPAPQPAAQPAAAPPAALAALPAGTLQADSLGAELLEQVASWLEDAADTVTETVHNVADLPRVWTWLVLSLSDPAARHLLFSAAWRLAVVIGCAVVAEYCLRFLLRRPLYLIERRAAYLHDLAAKGAQASSAEDGFNPDAPDTAPASDPAETTPSDIDPGAIDPGAIDRGAVDDKGAPVGIVPRDESGLALTAPKGWLWARRIPWAIIYFFLSLLPVVLFAIAGNSLLGTDLGTPKAVRLAGIAAVNAYVLVRAISFLTAFFVMSRSRGLRLLPVRDHTAAYIEVWVFRIAGTALFGIALAEMAAVLGLSPSGHDALQKVVAFIVAIYLVIVILQCRHTVARWLHARPGRVGPVAAVLNRLASWWHFFAIAFVLALWTVWAMGIRHGFAKLADLVLVLVGGLVAARLATALLHAAFDRLFKIDDEVEQRFPGLKTRANRYYPVLRGAISLVVTVVAVIAILQGWGLDAFAWFHGDEIGSRLVSAAVTVAIAILLGVAVWEGTAITLDRHMMRLDRSGDYLHAARLRTLIPIMKTVLLVMVSVVVLLTILSEIGVNIAPLLAGASIIGVALGFGSQKLVQDFITGIFLLLENAMQVGDYITASGLSGTVEKLSIRTIRLRAGDGAVHIIPFSSVGTVTNVNRGVGNAAVRVTVAADQDIDSIGEVLKEIAKEMRKEDDYRRLMRSDLQLWGVDDVQPGAVTLAGQIVCSDAGRWGVQREFNRRMARRFGELGIKLAAPQQYLVLARPSLANDAIAAEDATAHGAATPQPDHPPAAAKAEKDGTDKKDDAGKKDEDDKGPASVRNSPPPSALGHTE